MRLRANVFPEERFIREINIFHMRGARSKNVGQIEAIGTFAPRDHLSRLGTVDRRLV